MKAEIITIGDEILIGHILNRNAQWIANCLTENGFEVERIVTLPDDKNVLVAYFQEVQKRVDFVFVTGGLGPTNDDVTRIAISEFFHTKWTLSRDVYNRLEKFLREREYSMSHLNEEQAKVPDGAKVYMNDIGTAPGLLLGKGNTQFIFLPGVHFEMTQLLESSIIPELKKRYIKYSLINQVVITQGIPEAYLAEKLKGWEQNLPGTIKIAYLPSPGIVKLRISGKEDDSGGIKSTIDQKIEELKSIIPEYFVTSEQTTFEQMVGDLLTKNKQTLSTAESCTGGGIAARITSVSGSSAYFKGSVIAYSNKIKENHLGVPSEILEKYGAVSKQVTENMAQNILKLYNTDYSIAVSGVAGPAGGTEEKPVGTTWITAASKYHIISQRYRFGNKRDVNTEKTIVTALNMLRKLIIEKK
jgi:nicotinamide-nucleotide amidase